MLQQPHALARFAVATVYSNVVLLDVSLISRTLHWVRPAAVDDGNHLVTVLALTPAAKR